MNRNPPELLPATTGARRGDLGSRYGRRQRGATPPAAPHLSRDSPGLPPAASLSRDNSGHNSKYFIRATNERGDVARIE